MLRVIATIVLPLLLPTALYLGWVWIARRSHLTGGGGGGGAGEMRWARLPWLWLAGAGAVLLAIVLLVVTVGFGTTRQGVYVPPRLVNGHIVPSHIEPGPPQR